MNTRNFKSVEELQEVGKRIDDTISSLMEIKEVFEKNQIAMSEFYEDSKLTDKDLEIKHPKNFSVDNFEKVMHSEVYQVYNNTYNAGDVLLAYMIGVSDRYPYRVLDKRRNKYGIDTFTEYMYCLGLKPLDSITCKELDAFVKKNMRQSLLYCWSRGSIFKSYENSLMTSKLAEQIYQNKTYPLYLNTGFSYWLDCEETGRNGEKLYSWVTNGVVNYATADELGDVKCAVVPFTIIAGYDPYED